MIQSHPDAPEGSVASLPSYTPSLFSKDSAILCRNTAPLIGFAFGLIQRGVGCKVLGREIGQGLVTLVENLHPSDLPDLERKLPLFESREREKFLRKFDEAGAEAVTDKVRCIELFLSKARSISDLTQAISNLFSDDNRGLVTLATVHKAKGLEWPTVFILDFDSLMPSPWAKLPWQKTQENNLIYVAITRAKLDLRYIKSDCWKADGASPKAQTKLESLQNQD